MNQKEKTQISYHKILNAAIAEFGTHSYESASINTICSENHISKGLIYHNFENKDELYLRCVEVCFNEITAYLSSSQYASEDARENMHQLLSRRQQFFEENPYLGNIFFQAVLNPPKHLLQEIHEIRRGFDEFHAARYRELLEEVELRDGITVEMATEYFFIFQEMFNSYFQNKVCGNTDFLSLVKDNEICLSNILNILFYGIAKENPTS